MHTELLALAGRQAVNAAQTIGIVVFIILTSIATGLSQQTANWVALELGGPGPLWSFTSFAVAGFFDIREMLARVVAETARRVVDALFLGHAVLGVVSKAVGGVVFVDRRGEA